jgi:hypothetical protein
VSILRRVGSFVLAAFLLVTLFFPAVGYSMDNPSSSYSAGVAKVKLSPNDEHLKDGVYLGGYGGYLTRGKATGVMDDIYARSLAVSAGTDVVVFVTLDVTGIGNKVLKEIREKASQETGVPAASILISATHTHAGPDFQGLWGGVAESYKNYFIQQTVKSIKQAVGSQNHVTLRSGTVEVPQELSRNRRDWGYTDQTLTALQFLQKGKALATFINYAAHTTVFGSGNTKVSTDYVGPLQASVESEFGGIAMFVNGSLGDATPRPQGEGDVRASNYGKALAKYVKDAVDNAKNIPPGLTIKSRNIQFKVENPGFIQAYKAGIISPFYEMKENADGMFSESAITRITFGNKNNNVEMITVPGEATTRLGLDLRDVMDGKNELILGLTQDSLGYLIPSDEWGTGRNSNYEESVSVGKEAGDQVKAAVLALFKADGKKNELKAGVAKVSITPTAEMMDASKQGPIYLGGYGNGRKADPNQVWDDLWARTVILQQGEQTVAFTALDSVGVFNHDTHEIQKRAREALEASGIEVDHIVVSSTHTHHAPDTMGLWGPGGKSGINPSYQKFLIEQAANSIVQAAYNMETVKELRFGSEPTSDIIRDSRDPVVADENIYVMHLLGEKNKTIGTLVKWASHPETILGHYNEAITSDYVHTLRETVEKEVGGTTVFVNGAIGGLLTSLKVDVGLGTGKEGSIETMKIIGERAGQAAISAIKESGKSKDQRIQYVKESIYLPLENPNFYLLGYIEVLKRDVYIDGIKQDRMPLPPQLGGKQVDLLSEVSVVTIGDGQFAMVPGELYPEIELGQYQLDELAHNPGEEHEQAIRPNMTGKYPFVIGLANDAIGYIIPKNDFVPLVQNGSSWGEGVHRVQRKELYGEVNSVGPSTASVISNKIVEILQK